MNGKAFLDTNILVYAADRSGPGKRKAARDLISRLTQEGTPWAFPHRWRRSFL